MNIFLLYLNWTLKSLLHARLGHQSHKSLSQSIFVVKETERAVKLRFGEIVEADVPPGLHFKLPIVNTVRKFDARILTLDAAPQSYLTSEKKALTVDSFVKWRVSDVEKYFTTTGGDEERLRRQLIQRVDALSLIHI